jgi:hypothetical protein
MANGMLYANQLHHRAEKNALLIPEGVSLMGDIVFIIGLIVFFVLAVLYVAALERI